MKCGLMYCIFCGDRFSVAYKSRSRNKNYCFYVISNPNSNVHGANMGPTWVLSAQMGPCLPHEPCCLGRIHARVTVFCLHVLYSHVTGACRVMRLINDINTPIGMALSLIARFMGPTSAPGEPPVGHMKFPIWDGSYLPHRIHRLVHQYQLSCT